MKRIENLDNKIKITKIVYLLCVISCLGLILCGVAINKVNINEGLFYFISLIFFGVFVVVKRINNTYIEQIKTIKKGMK